MKYYELYIKKNKKRKNTHTDRQDIIVMEDYIGILQ